MATNGDVEERTSPLEDALRRRLSALGPEPRARLLRLLNLPSAEPATLIGVLYPHPEFRSLTESLIDLEEDLPTLAVVVAELRRMEREDYLHALGSGTMGRTRLSSVPDPPQETTQSGDQVSVGTMRDPNAERS